MAQRRIGCDAVGRPRAIEFEVIVVFVVVIVVSGREQRSVMGRSSTDEVMLRGRRERVVVDADREGSNERVPSAGAMCER